MKSHHGKSRGLALLSVLLLALTGCQAVKTERAAFTKRGDKNHGARSTPVQVVKKRNQIDESTLLHIGSLSEEIDLEQCFGSDCKTFNKTADTTSKLLREAAAKGADVVLLVKDNVRDSSLVTKKGRCLDKISSLLLHNTNAR